MGVRRFCLNVFLVVATVSVVAGLLLGMRVSSAVVIGLSLGAVHAIVAYIAARTRIRSPALEPLHLEMNPLPNRQRILVWIGLMLAAGIVSGLYWQLSLLGWLLWVPTTVVLGILLAWASNRAG